jgi:hypothetical protein
MNLKATIPSTNYDRPRTPEECGIYYLLGKHDKKDARCDYEIKSRIAMSKAPFN